MEIAGFLRNPSSLPTASCTKKILYPQASLDVKNCDISGFLRNPSSLPTASCTKKTILYPQASLDVKNYFFCGDSGIRTRVQTRNQYAFYTLILAFYFRAMARPKPPTIALSAKISFWHRSLPKPVPIFPHRLIHSASGRWLGAMSRFSTLCRN